MWLPLHKMPSFSFSRKRKRDSRESFLLSKPKTAKLNEENVLLQGMEIGHSSMQGYRVSMEDEHIISKMISLPDHVLVAIMDGDDLNDTVLGTQIMSWHLLGHAGKVAARFVASEMLKKVEETDAWNEYILIEKNLRHLHTDLVGRALVQAYKAIDDSLYDYNDMVIIPLY